MALEIENATSNQGSPSRKPGPNVALTDLKKLWDM
jgi:hypothetical protein